MTLEDTLAQHRLEVNADTMSCTCGEGFVTDWADSLDPDDTFRYSKDMYDAHYNLVLQDWLTTNRYGSPLSLLRPGTTCLVCGCVVGLPSQHRKVCP